MKLSDRFGPIPLTVTLDGSGNGTVTFQPNGCNARVTNLFVKVATSVAQSTCTLYKGQIADGNAVQSTNSGSTGAPAVGIIDLLDGETLYIRWTGGDAGAVATATVTGMTIPFELSGPSNITWADPVAAGDGSLIFPAIKSPNFVTGVSGWKLDRNGNIELNSGTFRGELDVLGTNNSEIQIFNDAGSATIEITPPSNGANNFNAAFIQASSQSSSSTLSFTSPIVSTSAAQTTNILLVNDPNGVLFYTKSFIDVNADVINSVEGTKYFRGQTGSGSAAVPAAATTVVTAGTTFTFTTPFAVGITPNVHVNMNNNAAATATWNIRAVGITNTGFDIRGSGAAPGGAGFTLGFTYTAIIP